jgi:hypothetical protein
MDQVHDLLVVYLGSIDKRLLEDHDQDDGVHGPLLPSQGDRGSCTAVTVATDHQDLERRRRARAEVDDCTT